MVEEKQSKIEKGSAKPEKFDSKNRKNSKPEASEKFSSAGDLAADVKETKKVDTKKKEVRVHDKAVANGFSLRISAKYAKFICRMIRGKSPDAAVARLQEVIDERRAVPMAGLEVAHQKGKGMSGGKFPKNACVAIMEIVKQAKANATMLGVENMVISQAISNKASRPFRRAGRKGKRAHVMIEIKDAVKMKEAKK